VVGHSSWTAGPCSSGVPGVRSTPSCLQATPAAAAFAGTGRQQLRAALLPVRCMWEWPAATPAADPSCSATWAAARQLPPLALTSAAPGSLGCAPPAWRPADRTQSPAPAAASPAERVGRSPQHHRELQGTEACRPPNPTPRCPVRREQAGRSWRARPRPRTCRASASI